MDVYQTAQLLGNLGEFVGAAAVVASLAYLAVQLRRNTLATRASLDFAIRSDFNRWHEIVMTDPRMAELLQRLGDSKEDYPAKSFANWLLNRYANVQTAFDANIFRREEFPAWKADFTRQMEMFPRAVPLMQAQMRYYGDDYFELWDILEPLKTIDNATGK